MALTPEQRRLRASIAAHAQWVATPDWSARTAKARQTFLDRFERQVDPVGELDPVVRAKRAEAARRAYFVGLALKSSRARGAKKAKAGDGAT